MVHSRLSSIRVPAASRATDGDDSDTDGRNEYTRIARRLYSAVCGDGQWLLSNLLDNRSAKQDDSATDPRFEVRKRVSTSQVGLRSVCQLRSKSRVCFVDSRSENVMATLNRSGSPTVACVSLLDDLCCASASETDPSALAGTWGWLACTADSSVVPIVGKSHFQTTVSNRPIASHGTSPTTTVRV